MSEIDEVDFHIRKDTSWSATVIAVLDRVNSEIYYVMLEVKLRSPPGPASWDDHEFLCVANAMSSSLGNPSRLIRGLNPASFDDVVFGYQKESWLKDEFKADRMIQVQFSHAKELKQLLVNYQIAQDAICSASFDYSIR